MELTLINFRRHVHLTVDLSGGEFILITGRSGVGKTSLFMALDFALTGRGKKIIRYGCKSCAVQWRWTDPDGGAWWVKRTKGPNRLLVRGPDDREKEDAVAQALLDDMFSGVSWGYVSSQARTGSWWWTGTMGERTARLERLLNFGKKRNVDPNALEATFHAHWLREKNRSISMEKKEIHLRETLLHMGISPPDGDDHDDKEKLEEKLEEEETWTFLCEQKEKAQEKCRDVARRVSQHRLFLEKGRLVPDGSLLFPVVSRYLSARQTHADQVERYQKNKEKWKDVPRVTSYHPLEKEVEKCVDLLDSYHRHEKTASSSSSESHRRMTRARHAWENHRAVATVVNCPACGTSCRWDGHTLEKNDPSLTVSEGSKEKAFLTWKKAEERWKRDVGAERVKEEALSAFWCMYRTIFPSCSETDGAPDSYHIERLKEEESTVNDRRKQKHKWDDVVRRIVPPEDLPSAEGLPSSDTSLLRSYVQHWKTEREKWPMPLSSTENAHRLAREEEHKWEKKGDACRRKWWDQVDECHSQFVEAEEMRKDYADLENLVQRAKTQTLSDTVQELQWTAQAYLDAFTDDDHERLFIHVSLEKGGVTLQLSQIADETKHLVDEANLSGGEHARVFLALSLATADFCDTPWLTLDECTASLDDAGTSRVFQGIRRVRQERLIRQRPIFYIAHQITTGCFDRVIHLNS